MKEIHYYKQLPEEIQLTNKSKSMKQRQELTQNFLFDQENLSWRRKNKFIF